MNYFIYLEISTIFHIYHTSIGNLLKHFEKISLLNDNSNVTLKNVITCVDFVWIYDICGRPGILSSKMSFFLHVSELNFNQIDSSLILMLTFYYKHFDYRFNRIPTISSKAKNTPKIVFVICELLSKLRIVGHPKTCALLLNISF